MDNETGTESMVSHRRERARRRNREEGNGPRPGPRAPRCTPAPGPRGPLGRGLRPDLLGTSLTPSSHCPLPGPRGLEHAQAAGTSRRVAHRPLVPTAARANGHPRGDRRRDLGLPPDSASTALSSELESSSFVDSDEEDNTSRCV